MLHEKICEATNLLVRMEIIAPGVTLLSTSITAIINAMLQEALLDPNELLCYFFSQSEKLVLFVSCFFHSVKI
jgi:hypothetical protein